MRTFVLVAISASALAGCAAEPLVAPGYGGASPIALTPSGVPLSIKVGAAQALAQLPPEAGPVIAVSETRHANGVEQEIVLGGRQATAGENKISVTELTPADPAWRGSSEGDLRIRPPTDVAVQTEMEKAFPTVAMQISSDYETSAQGPFGYAAGKSGRANCIYAWQYLAPARSLNLVEGASGLGDYPISVRVRLCRNLPVATLVDLVRHMQAVRPGYGAVYAPIAAASTPMVVLPQPGMTAPVLGSAVTGVGGVVVPGPVTATPFGVVASVPLVSGMTPVAYPLQRPVLSAALSGAGGLADGEPAVRRRTARVRPKVRRAVLRTGVGDAGQGPRRGLGPVIPLPSEIFAPAPTSVAPPRAAAPSAPALTTPDDSLPMPK